MMSCIETLGGKLGDEFFVQPCEVVSRESPIEGRGHGLVVVLEAQQSVLDLFDAGEVIGSKCFALDDGKIDFDLVEPTGVDGAVDGDQVGKGLRQASHAGRSAMRGAVMVLSQSLIFGQNPKIESQQFNNLQTSKLSKKQLCDRTNQSPVFTSAGSATFVFNSSSSFTVAALGFPVPSISETGALPAGVTFTDNGNGTATISGMPSTAGTFGINLTASNGAGSATQSFTLTVGGAIFSITVSPTVVDFGTVRSDTSQSRTVTIQNTGTTPVSITKISLIPASRGDDTIRVRRNCPASLAAGASCEVKVNFDGERTGQHSATLRVTYEGPGSPQDVNITGTVVRR